VRTVLSDREVSSAKTEVCECKKMFSIKTL